MILRPYQEKILDDLRGEVNAGRDPLLVMPCGGGKGSVISVIVKNAVGFGHSVVFTTRGRNLIADMSMRVRKLGIEHGVLMGGVRRQRQHSVQVASIDTLLRMEHLPRASILIVDEADLAISPIYKKVVQRFDGARTIGMTATPIRTSGEGLGKSAGGLFDSIVLGPNENELIAGGYLVGSYVLAPPPPAELSNLRKTAGEFNVKQGAEICDKPKVIGDAVEHWKKHAPQKKTVAFCWDQKHANDVAEQYRCAGVNFAYVDANTPLGDERNPLPGTRAHMYRELAEQNGNLMGISSIGTLTTGWDCPIVSCLVILRKTASLRLWRQILGRGSRPYPSKEKFAVHDHVGNTNLHNPYGFFEDEIPWSLSGEEVREGQEKKTLTSTCKQSVMNCWCQRADQHNAAGDHLACYATFKASMPACPYCGCPVIKKQRKVETVDGELQFLERSMLPPAPARPPRSSEPLKDAGTPTSRRRLLDFMLEKAKAEGKKAGWARHVVEAKTGMPVPVDWMPKEWRDEHGY